VHGRTRVHAPPPHTRAGAHARTHAHTQYDKFPDYSSFESICVDISKSCFSRYFICIYRPPGQLVNFFDEVQDLLANVSTMHTYVDIVGDFNLHLDIRSATTNTFIDILASFDTKQHVNFPTHTHGHWLDLLVTRSSCKTFTDSDSLSDNNTVITNYKVPITPAVSKHKVFYRAIQSINFAALITDILTSHLVTLPKENVSDLYEQYCQVLKILFWRSTQKTPKIVQTFRILHLKWSDKVSNATLCYP